MAKKQNQTLVTFLLDRTGSMQPIKDDTIGAFNAYRDGLEKSGEPIKFSLVQFDSQSIDKICVATPIDKVAPLTPDTYQPRSATPLIDASFKTIKAVEKSLNGEVGNTKIVICIQTDGHENASTEHTWDELNALIKEKTALGWQFNFMGAGIDAYDTGARMGVMAESTLSYDRQNSRQAFAAAACSTARFASGETMDVAFTSAERAASGDKYAPSSLLRKPQPAQSLRPKIKRAIVDDIVL